MKRLSIIRLIPNIFTFLSLTLGLTSIKFALESKWEISVSLIVFASFLDNVDGKLARLLKSSSDFGVELDSLSDFLSFGIAPALIVYFWTMSLNLENSWAFVIFYSICSSSRLARFNTNALDENNKIELKFFRGISTPAAAGLVLLPMMLHFRFQNDVFLNPFFSAFVLVIAGIFMISNIPSFSMKGFKLKKSVLPFLILVFASFLSLLITDFWLAMILFICTYFFTIPLAFFKWKTRHTDS